MEWRVGFANMLWFHFIFSLSFFSSLPPSFFLFSFLLLFPALFLPLFFFFSFAWSLFVL